MSLIKHPQSKDPEEVLRKHVEDKLSVLSPKLAEYPAVKSALTAFISCEYLMQHVMTVMDGATSSRMPLALTEPYDDMHRAVLNYMNAYGKTLGGYYAVMLTQKETLLNLTVDPKNANVLFENVVTQLKKLPDITPHADSLKDALIAFNTAVTRLASATDADNAIEESQKMKEQILQAKDRLLKLRMSKVEHEVLLTRLKNNSSRHAILTGYRERLEQEIRNANLFKKRLDEAERQPDVELSNIYNGSGDIFTHLKSRFMGKTSLQILRDNYCTVQSRIDTLREMIEKEEHGGTQDMLIAEARIAQMDSEIKDTVNEVETLSGVRDRYETKLLENRLFAHGCDSHTSAKLIRAMQGAKRQTVLLTSSSASLATFYLVANNMFTGMKDLTIPSILTMANQILMFAVVGEYAHNGAVTLLDDPVTVRFVKREHMLSDALTAKVISNPTSTTEQMEKVKLLKESTQAVAEEEEVDISNLPI
jgi:hypothetical protein